MGIKDSQYTKSEYTEMLARLQRQLQQAKSLGDTEEAKELQKEIDDLKALESGVQDKKTKDFDERMEYIKELNYALKDAERNKDFKKAVNIKKEIEKMYKEMSEDSDTEAKITDLTEKAKAARAQGYAADQYEAEIEKLKALDKKTKDFGSIEYEIFYKGIKFFIAKDNLSKEYLGWYVDRGRRINIPEVNSNNLSTAKSQLDKEKDEIANHLINDAYDEVDWLTLDPLTDKGKEILASMKKEYGDEQGEKIFYASKNAGKITGVDSVKDGWGIIASHKGYKILREYAESTGNPTGRYMAAPENFRSGVEFDKIQGNSIEEVKKKIDKEK